MCRTRAVVLTGLLGYSLSLIAAVIDALGTAGSLERLVREIRPALARLLDPPGSVKRAALRRTTALGLVRIGAPEPFVTRSLDPVILTFREHEVSMRVVGMAVPVAALVN